MKSLRRLIQLAVIRREQRSLLKVDKQRTSSSASRFRLEPLEPRLLLSADVTPVALTADLNGASGPAPLLLTLSDTKSPVSSNSEISGAINRSAAALPATDTEFVSTRGAGGDLIAGDLNAHTNLAITPTIVWNVDSNGFWDDASNWRDTANNANRLPLAGDDILIDRGAANPIITVRTANQVGHSLLSNESIVISAGSLSLGADSEIDASFTLSGSGMLQGTGAVTLNNPSTWSGGTMSGTGITTFNSSLEIIGGSVVHDISGRTTSSSARRPAPCCATPLSRSSCSTSKTADPTRRGRQPPEGGKKSEMPVRDGSARQRRIRAPFSWRSRAAANRAVASSIHFPPAASKCALKPRSGLRSEAVRHPVRPNV